MKCGQLLNRYSGSKRCPICNQCIEIMHNQGILGLEYAELSLHEKWNNCPYPNRTGNSMRSGIIALILTDWSEGMNETERSPKSTPPGLTWDMNSIIHCFM